MRVRRSKTWAPLIWVDRRTDRVYLRGRRVHHGLAGVVGAVVGLVLVAVSAALIIDDWHDRPWPMTREVFL
jgi:hypothetical protein